MCRSMFRCLCSQCQSILLHDRSLLQIFVQVGSQQVEHGNDTCAVFSLLRVRTSPLNNNSRSYICHSMFRCHCNQCLSILLHDLNLLLFFVQVGNQQVEHGNGTCAVFSLLCVRTSPGTAIAGHRFVTAFSVVSAISA